MTKEVAKRAAKYALATYLSILAVFLFGFKMTTSIAFSAIFVISYGATRHACLSYAVNRVIVQISGVICGWLLYTLANSALVNFLPESQRMALAMAIGVVVVLTVKSVTKFAIADFTVITPVFLTLLMMPNNPGYPGLRIIYCGIGVCIGIAVNLAVFPPHIFRQTELECHLQRACALTVEMLESFAHTLSLCQLPIERLELLAASNNGIREGLQMLDENRLVRKKADSQRQKWKKLYQLNQATLEMMRGISALSLDTLRQAQIEWLKDTVHTLLLVYRQAIESEHSIVLPELAVLPDGKWNTYDAALAASEVVIYYRQLVKFFLVRNDSENNFDK